MNEVIKISIVFMCFSIISGCAVHVSAGDNSTDRDYESIFGGIDIDTGSNVGDLSSVNGSIDIGSNVVAKSVDTVNGGINIGSDVKLMSAETVNGGIEAEKGLSVSRNLETVNGSVVVKENSTIDGSILTVNGDIDLTGVEVGKNLETVNGDIKLINTTKVLGDLTYQNSGGFFSGWGNDKPVLVIDATSSILGTINLYRPVDLEIAEGAKIGEIKRYYTRK